MKGSLPHVFCWPSSAALCPALPVVAELFFRVCNFHTMLWNLRCCGCNAYLSHDLVCSAVWVFYVLSLAASRGVQQKTRALYSNAVVAWILPDALPPLVSSTVSPAYGVLRWIIYVMTALIHSCSTHRRPTDGRCEITISANRSRTWRSRWKFPCPISSRHAPQKSAFQDVRFGTRAVLRAAIRWLTRWRVHALLVCVNSIEPLWGDRWLNGVSPVTIVSLLRECAKCWGRRASCLVDVLKRIPIYRSQRLVSVSLHGT